MDGSGLKTTMVVARISLSAYARSRRERGLPGGTLRSVQKACLTGRITRHHDGIDPIEADADWDGKASPDAKTRRKTADHLRTANEPKRVPTSGSPKSDPDPFIAARARRELAAARKAEIELGKIEGRLVPAEEILDQQKSVAGEVREHLLNFATRAAPALAALTGHAEGEIFNVLDKSVRAHLDEKSRALGVPSR